MMKKFNAALLGMCLIFVLGGCGSQEKILSHSFPVQTGSEEAYEPSDETPILAGVIENDGNILVAYFTWAENTQVEDPAAIAVDATTSASVLPPGNAAKIAGWIAERTGGDLFSIVVTEPYASDYDECLNRAAGEKAGNARPELLNHVDNMAVYDIVFLGFPNWWYTVPMAIHSFLEAYDFSGKTVIPFVTHGTSGLSRTIQDISGNLPRSAMVLEPIGIYRPEVDYAQPAVNEWLDRLRLTPAPADTVPSLGEAAGRTIIMAVNNRQASIVLYDTPAADALYDMLPLELTFEDFNGTEKISYPPDALPTEEALDSYTPKVGDICLYATWGNLCIFYEDFRESSGLIPLGRVSSGMEVITAMDENFAATLTAVKE